MKALCLFGHRWRCIRAFLGGYDERCTRCGKRQVVGWVSR